MQYITHMAQMQVFFASGEEKYSAKTHKKQGRMHDFSYDAQALTGDKAVIDKQSCGNYNKM